MDSYEKWKGENGHFKKEIPFLIVFEYNEMKMKEFKFSVFGYWLFGSSNSTHIAITSAA